MSGTSTSDSTVLRTEPNGGAVPPLASRRSLDLLAYGLMLLLCVIWGFQQIAIKLTVVDMTPVMQLATRFAGSAAIFRVLVLAREGVGAFGDGTLRSGLVVGVLFAFEFLLLAEGLKYTSAAHAVVFLYTAPVFSALGLQFLPEERLSPVQWLGIAIALCGISIAFLGQSQKGTVALLPGDALALAAGMSWGLGAVVLRRSRLAAADATKTVFYQVTTAALVLGIYASATGQQHFAATSRVALSIVFQTLGVAVLSYFAWFWLLRHYLTSRLMLLALMTPLFGVMFGYVVLREEISPRFGIGTGLVLAGIAVVQGAQLIRARY